ncbi:MAG TPA: HlyD family efflux transporter periplasmic adaptor subunit [Gemmatimonadaceae bacterium]|nr:HlyD family efflux transporter periplasmic adaptor subunit [Gemmatimonadaceae bacterium]
MKFDTSVMQSSPAPRSRMDVPREPRTKRGRYVVIGAGGGLLIAVAALAMSLKPAVPSVDGSTLVMDSVRRGDMVREVRGPGTLVPEQIRWISAVTSARVERIVAQPGQVVEPNTVLLEMSNPDVQIQALQAEQALSEAQTRLADLRVQLEGSKLAQQGTVAQVRTANVSAAQERMAADTLLADRLISKFEYNNRRAAAEESSTRLEIEQKRLDIMSRSVNSQLAAQQTQIDRLKAIAVFQENRVQSLVVHAGEHGVLQELALQPGQWVNGGATLAKVVQPGKLKAVLRIGEIPAKDVAIGQSAAIDTRNGIVAGHVSRMDPASQGGTVTVDVSLDGKLPGGARPDQNIDGTIQLERMKNIVYTGRPALGDDNAVISMFKLDDDRKSATRVNVRLGRVSANSVEIVQGLKPGDKVILTDLSLPDNTERIRIR